MRQIYEVWPSISDRIAHDRAVSISLRINTSCSFDTQMQPLLFTDKKSISSPQNNTICISVVSKQMQSEILQLPLGNSSFQILRERSWQWAFATSFPGHCTHKASWVPHFSWATLFSGCDSVMNLWIGRLRNASCVLWQLKLGTCFTFTISSASSDIISLLWLTAKNN